MIDEHATIAEIDLRAIAHNLEEIRKRVAPAKIMAVVKSNAYGHGLKRIVETAVQHGVEYFGVARVHEGIELRKYHPTVPVLVFGGFFENQVQAFLSQNLEFTLFDETRAATLHHRATEAGRRARVHIKVDTGMGRIGVDWRAAVQFVEKICEYPGLEIVAIYTHLASSDERDKAFTHEQIRRFREILDRLKSRGINIPMAHTANSAAILDLPESFFEMVRPGVSLYGYYPSNETSESLELWPAMRLRSKVVAIKQVASDTPISYNSTFRTRARTRIATVAIGYGDGYNRLLSNQGEALIAGQRFPIVGRVCMDQIMVDVGMEQAVAVGDEVVLMGRQGDEQISIYEICEKLNTIPYEVTSWVSERVPRVYIR